VPSYVGGGGGVASPPLGPVVEAEDVGMGLGVEERAAAEALCRMGGNVG